MGRTLVKLVVLLGLVFSTGGAHATENASVYSKLPIQKQCTSAYQKGQQVFQKAVELGVNEKGDEAFIHYFDTELRKVGEDADCQLAFSLGAYDARGIFQQTLVLEYLLELEVAESNEARNETTRFFSKRFQSAGLETEALKKFSLESLETRDLLANFKKNLHSTARSNGAAVPFGRFIFVSGSDAVFTAYEFQRNANGEILLGTDGKPVVLPGSYQKLAENLWNRAKRLTEEYLAWRPGIVYGDDTFWKGSFWRAIGLSKEPSPREIKEEGFANLMQLILNFADQNDLNRKPFFDLYSLMLKKERAYLERDLRAYDRIFVGVCAAPLIPVGMYAGAAGFAYAGFSAATSANTAALFSLGTLATFTGIGVNNAIHQRSQNPEAFRMVDALDQVIIATVGSFPLAAAMPALAGGTAATGKFALVSAKQAIASTIELGQTVKNLGFSGTLLEIPKLPYYAVRSWATAWWQHKILFVHLGVEASISAIFEIGYRQVEMEGEDKFYWVDENGVAHVNEQALINIGSSIFFNTLTMPLTYVPSLTHRLILNRGASILSNVLAQLLVSKQMTNERLIFDQLWGSTVSSGVGEVERAIKLSGFVTSQSPARQYLLLLAFRLITKSGTTPLKVHAQNLLLKNDLSVIPQIKEYMKQAFAIDIDDYSDEAIRETLLALERN